MHDATRSSDGDARCNKKTANRMMAAMTSISCSDAGKYAIGGCARLAGCSEWDEFDAKVETRPVLSGPARSLAGTLNVSLRTVYRDVADLQLSGVPIEGEAGVGYMLRKGADIPPLMFNADELEALVVETRFVRAFGGERLGISAVAALLKINAVLPCAATRARTSHPHLRARTR